MFIPISGWMANRFGTLSAVVFRSLRGGDGSDMSQHRAVTLAADGKSRAALAHVPPPSP